MKGIVGFIYALMTFVYSCNKPVTVSDFFKKVPGDADYKKEVTVGDFKLTSYYRPSELICLSEIVKGKNNFRFDKKVFDEEMKKYSNSCYFDIIISLNNGDNVMLSGLKNRADYAARVGELTYLLTQDCYLLANDKDTIRALTSVFSNTYGNDPNVKFMVVFPRNKIHDEKIDLVYRDKLFGIKEKAVFAYDNDELAKKIPGIKQ